MNCPSDEQLDFCLEFGSSSPERDLILRHVSVCELCAAKLAAQRRLLDIVGLAIATPAVPQDVFDATQRRIESHELYLSRLRISVSVVAMMVVCLIGVWRSQNSTEPVVKVPRSESTSLRNFTGSTMNLSDETHTASRVTVSTPADMIAVPTDSGSTEVSIFTIYQAFNSEEQNDDSSSYPKATTNIARI